MVAELICLSFKTISSDIVSSPNSLNLSTSTSSIGKVIVGGNDAPWVKRGAELLGGLYELDRFHLKRALHRGLANDRLAAEVYQACVVGEIDKVERLLAKAQEKAGGDKATEIIQFRGYLKTLSPPSLAIVQDF